MNHTEVTKKNLNSFQMLNIKTNKHQQVAAIASAIHPRNLAETERHLRATN